MTDERTPGMQTSIPNTVTWVRIALIPFFIIVFYLPFWWARPAAAMVFAAAAITDWLDGYLARRLGQTSRFGAFLDPVADKLIVAAALVLLVQSAPMDFREARFTPDDMESLVTLAAVIIIGREIAISALREWMAEIGQRARVAVSPLGRVKTTAQITAVIMLLFKLPLLGLPIYALGLVSMLVAAALTLWSMVNYLRAAWPLLRDVP